MLESSQEMLILQIPPRPTGRIMSIENHMDRIKKLIVFKLSAFCSISCCKLYVEGSESPFLSSCYDVSEKDFVQAM
jgi:hypothetical protein